MKVRKRALETSWEKHFSKSYRIGADSPALRSAIKRSFELTSESEVDVAAVKRSRSSMVVVSTNTTSNANELLLDIIVKPLICVA